MLLPCYFRQCHVRWFFFCDKTKIKYKKKNNMSLPPSNLDYLKHLCKVNLMVQGENPSLAFQLIRDFGLASVVFPIPSTNLTKKLGSSLVCILY